MTREGSSSCSIRRQQNAILTTRPPNQGEAHACTHKRPCAPPSTRASAPQTKPPRISSSSCAATARRAAGRWPVIVTACDPDTQLRRVIARRTDTRGGRCPHRRPAAIAGEDRTRPLRHHDGWPRRGSRHPDSARAARAARHDRGRVRVTTKACGAHEAHDSESDGLGRYPKLLTDVASRSSPDSCERLRRHAVLRPTTGLRRQAGRRLRRRLRRASPYLARKARRAEAESDVECGLDAHPNLSGLPARGIGEMASAASFRRHAGIRESIDGRN